MRSYNAIFEKQLGYKPQDVCGWNLKCDYLIHGSPCQSYSIAGKQEGGDPGSGTASSLMWETIKIIEHMGEWKPKVVIWENVTNVLSKTMRHNFDLYLSEMERLGYTNSYGTLDARDFGLPQKRKRVFTVSIHGGGVNKFDFAKLKKKPMAPLMKFIGDEYDETHIVKSPSMLNKINAPKLNSNFSISVLHDGDCAGTITTRQDRCPNAGIIEIGDGKYRLLTEKECWRLMGFSDEDFFAAQKANPSRDGFKNGALYKQAGNSMCVPVLESIFEELMDMGLMEEC